MEFRRRNTNEGHSNQHRPDTRHQDDSRSGRRISDDRRDNYRHDPRRSDSSGATARTGSSYRPRRNDRPGAIREYTNPGAFSPREDQNALHLNDENVVYGIHAVEELVRTRPQTVERIYFSDGDKSGALFHLLKECRGLRMHYQHIPQHRLDAIAGSDRNQGVAALCSQKEYADIQTLIDQAGQGNHTPLFMVAASVEDPGNLGAIIRSSVAFGVDGLMVERKNTVPLNNSVAKAAAGMLEHCHVAKPQNLESVLASLRESGYQIIGADGAATKTPDQIDLRQSTVLILGGEHRGIPAYLQKQCTDLMRIPIDPKVPSLNVSAAAAIALYEINRQRSALSAG